MLYSMTSSSGSMPWKLIEGNNGNLYGIAYNGGAHSYGTLFELTPAGQFNLLYTFCSLSNCADGSWPIALVQTADGTLYGATEGGGTKGLGTLYSFSPRGILTTLHNFTGKDGSTPYNLILGADANLYGTTNGGGGNGQCVPSGCGTIFRFNRAGQLAKLYTFCSQSNCTDGVIPTTLLQASDGNLYGATLEGGDQTCGQYYLEGCGTLFQLTSAGTLNTLHTFELTDGENPNVLVQDTDGSFYGATLNGGDMNAIDCTSYGCGTIFNLSTGLAPFVTLTRSSGRVGQSGGILGRGLTGTTGVFLNGTPSSFTVLSDTVIQATVPAGATSGFVTVQTPSGTLTSNVQFQVTQ